MRFVSTTLLAFALASTPVALAEHHEHGEHAESEAAAPDHADHEHQLVRIFERKVRPAVQKIHADDALGWLNYTAKIAQVSFDREVAKKLTCTAPGGFRLDGERLVSTDIQSTQFATLCNLAPGEYDYRVTLRSGAGISQGGTRELEGKIVVE